LTLIAVLGVRVRFIMTWYPHWVGVFVAINCAFFIASWILSKKKGHSALMNFLLRFVNAFNILINHLLIYFVFWEIVLLVYSGFHLLEDEALRYSVWINL
jgi:hypothetical protein